MNGSQRDQRLRLRPLTQWVIVLQLVPLLMCVLCATTASPSGVCSESKRRYPGDCRLFYRCVLLPAPTGARSATDAASKPQVAHAHVWVPTRCTAGLVFDPMLKRCVVPDDDWNCHNEDQLIPLSKWPVSTQRAETEDVTEDRQIFAGKGDEFSLTIPQLLDLDPEEEPEIVTNVIDHSDLMSQTPRLYQLPTTQNPFIPVTNIDDQNYELIAVQMNRIADLAHSLKAVTQTVATPVTIAHAHIPSSGGLSVTVNRHPTQLATEQHYQVNLLPIQLNKITAQLMQAKQSPISVNAQQQQTNLNLFGSSVLKHIVEQSGSLGPPSPMEQQNTERLVSALFNKYLANKSFVKKGSGTTSGYEKPVSGFQPENDIITGVRHVPVALRVKHGSATATTTAAPCISGVRLPNGTDCRRYYMCNESTATVHSYACPPYTAFDTVRRMCDMAQYASCVNAIGDDDGDGRVQQLPPVEACGTRDKLPDPTSQRRYVLCLRTHDGRWTRHQMTCPGSLVYCPRRNICSPKSSCYQ